MTINIKIKIIKILAIKDRDLTKLNNHLIRILGNMKMKNCMDLVPNNSWILPSQCRSSMMKVKLSRRFAYFGKEANVRMEITVHFYMLILKKSCLFVNIRKNNFALMVMPVISGISNPKTTRIQMLLCKWDL